MNESPNKNTSTKIDSRMIDPTTIDPSVKEALANLTLPNPNSHKGQNGKLLIIGGSDLFHAASKWSLDIASKFVDMVFYSSVPSNNQLVQEAKGSFWNGIVVPRSELSSYIEEADVILIGPGMTRTDDTQQITNELLAHYPTKKWVIDAGALQMVDPSLLNENHILTPHQGEYHTLEKNGFNVEDFFGVVVLKGKEDSIQQGKKTLAVAGGNVGMTKGGTGDVLAGLIAALYCNNDSWTAAVAGSFFNKTAGDVLFESVGPFFNSSDLVEAVPKAVWRYLQEIGTPHHTPVTKA